MRPQASITRFGEMTMAGKSDSQILQDRTDVIMGIVNERCAYYRANPHRFAEEYLGLALKLFQKILIWVKRIWSLFLQLYVRYYTQGVR